MSRRSQWTSAGDPATTVLITGDAGNVVGELRRQARLAGAEVLEGSEAGVSARIVIVVAAVSEDRSALSSGLAGLASIAPLLTPDCLRLVVAVRGAARVAPERLLRVLGPELGHQIQRSVTPIGAPGRERTRRERFGIAALSSLGVQVFRVAGSG